MGNKILTLFLTFLKIGAFTFGGGYAMIPLIQREIVESHGWVSDEDILEIIAIAESTPGPISVNTATFVGYRVAGVSGAFFATLGLVIPSFVVILIISSLLREFQEIKAVQYAFAGIRAGVVALVIKAWWTMYKKCDKTVSAYVIAALAFVAVAIFDLEVIYVLIACALAGLCVSLYAARKGEKSE
ncbi:MAG: chromate transporter [Clostridia bacterium]|nr:chromate transporter [Clostridia bacterium]